MSADLDTTKLRRKAKQAYSKKENFTQLALCHELADEDVPALCDEIDELRTRVAELENWLTLEE